MWRLKINLILKCRFLCIRIYLIVVIFLNWFFSFKLFFIVVKGTVKFNIYRRFINLFKKIEMVMHHVSFFLFLLCAILLIYTMGHKTRNWKTNLESGYLRWTCIFSLTFMTTLHLQSRYIARISFLIYIKVNFYYKSWLTKIIFIHHEQSLPSSLLCTIVNIHHKSKGSYLPAMHHLLFILKIHLRFSELYSGSWRSLLYNRCTSRRV